MNEYIIYIELINRNNNKLKVNAVYASKIRELEMAQELFEQAISDTKLICNRASNYSKVIIRLIHKDDFFDTEARKEEIKL